MLSEAEKELDSVKFNTVIIGKRPYYPSDATCEDDLEYEEYDKEITYSLLDFAFYIHRDYCKTFKLMDSYQDVINAILYLHKKGLLNLEEPLTYDEDFEFFLRSEYGKDETF